jgi:hypothetical protein
VGKSGSAAVKSFDIPKALVWQACYYGRFYRSRLYLLLQRINTYLMRWAGKKYKRLRGFRRFHAWWLGIVRHDPALFAHWRWVRTLTVAELR